MAPGEATGGPVDEARLGADIAALAAMTRDSAGPGEHAAALWIAQALLAAGIDDVRVEPYRYQSSYAGAHLLHLAAGLTGRVAAAAALVSLELEASGRRQWLRRRLPAGEGRNVTATVAPRGPRRATVVLVAHHDAALTSAAWRSPLVRLGDRPGHMSPLMALPAAGLAMRAAGLRRLGAALVLAFAATELEMAAERRTVPGANDNASGVAAVLALARAAARSPLDGVELMVACVGGEEAGMGGMRAWLDAHRGGLDARTTIVLGLDTLGSGRPIVAEAEGPILPHRYDKADLALADRAADAAGLERPARWRIAGWTDPILARFAGLRALSLLSVDAGGGFSEYHRPTDTADRVDLASVAAATRLASAIAGSPGR